VVVILGCVVLRSHHSYVQSSHTSPILRSLLPSSPLVTADSKNEDFYSDITEPSGWNETLDQAWRGAVQQAVSPTILMECVLLLEHYLNKAWLQVEKRSNCFYCLSLLSSHFTHPTLQGQGVGEQRRERALYDI
jgi:hypothetical protein